MTKEDLIIKVQNLNNDDLVNLLEEMATKEISLYSHLKEIFEDTKLNMDEWQDINRATIIEAAKRLKSLTLKN